LYLCVLKKINLPALKRTYKNNEGLKPQEKKQKDDNVIVKGVWKYRGFETSNNLWDL